MDPLTLIGAIPTALNTVNSLTSLFSNPYMPPKQYQENSREVFSKGGSIRGHNKYDAPHHNQGGQVVNNEGIPDPNGDNEIQLNESKYTYTRLNKKNPTYIFTPEDSQRVSELTKKYKNANTSNLEKNALELSVQRIENENEMKKKQQIKQYSKGGKIKKYYDGGSPTDSFKGLTDMFGNARNYSLPSDRPMQQIPQLPFQEVKSDPRIRPINQTIQPLDTGLEKRFVDQAKLRTPVTSSTMASKTSESTSNPLKTLDALRNLTLAGSSLGMLKRAEKEDPIMTDYGQARKQLNKLESNLDPMRQQYAQSSNQLRDVNRNSSSSYNSFSNREAQRVANLQQGLSGITLQEQQMNNQIASQKAQFESGVAQDNKQTLQQNRINNQQNSANSEFIKSQISTDVMAELDRKSTMINQANIAEGNTLESMAYLGTMFENFGPNDMSIVMKVKKQGMSSLTAEEKEQMLNWKPIKHKSDKAETDTNATT
jgi:hypothetical protein